MEKENVTENLNEEPKAEKKGKKKSGGKLAEENAKLAEELAAQKELLLRTAAEFDNYKRRTEKEKLGIAEYAKASLLKKMLPLIDNIERARGYESGSAEYNKGIEMIVKQLESLSCDLGLEEFGTEGDTFDPNIHEAVMHIEDPEKPENCIAAVMQKGYKIGDTVVRAAMVQVAN